MDYTAIDFPTVPSDSHLVTQIPRCGSCVYLRMQVQVLFPTTLQIRPTDQCDILFEFALCQQRDPTWCFYKEDHDLLLISRTPADQT